MAQDNLIVRRKYAKGEDGYRTFSVRIKEKTVNRIDQISAQTQRSRNELIGMFLEYALDKCIVESEQQSSI